MITTISDFTGSYRIPNITNASTASLINELIEENEDTLIASILGIDKPTDTDLDYLLISCVVRFIWFKWRADTTSEQSGAGVMISSHENATREHPIFKLNDVWNDLNTCVNNVWDYCETESIEINPTFEITYASWL